ncbi:MAG: phosphate ABC transporter permease PstA [Nitrospinales bacterium]
MRPILIERIAISFLFLATVIGCITLLGILALVIWKGSSALSISFLFSESQDFGAKGGIFYQAMGTFILMMTAGLISLPISLGSVLFQSEYLKSGRIKKFLRLIMYSLNGVPTIIFGLVGYLFFGVFLGLGISWITGALILAVMILPTVQVSIQEAVEAIPKVYRDTGSALGLNVWQQIRSIIIPQSLSGIITGLLLGLSRAAGETAAIMFTATVFSGVKFPQGWSDPVTTLQTHILILAQESVNPQTMTNAWGSGLILILIVFTLIAGSMSLRTKLYLESDR